ncbi:cytoplasmic dynein 2 intermediate chain 2 isoform X2 [Anabrus simplex]|uniref:cytoplasmic dynein 2 intermediate chain 2 isoform X2 n=1 Tax=Anabrus simplex TaxID=316456 RepID=UPI0035A2D59F
MANVLTETNFSDYSGTSVAFSSCWRSEPSLEDGEAQTETCRYEEIGCQSVTSESKWTQTDDIQIHVTAPVDDEKLAEFLRKVLPMVIAELNDAYESHAFDGYELIDDSEKDIRKLYSLRMTSQKEAMVSSLTWNSTGSVVALAYSELEHDSDSWCDHMGSIHLFNIDRRDFSPTNPSKILETSSCVTCVSAHPREPSILAAGTFVGEVLVWNLQRDEDTLLGGSGLVQGAHVDAVSQLAWIRNPNSRQGDPLLVSSGCDGRILIWKVTTIPENFMLLEQFAITYNSALKGNGKLRSPFGVAGSEVGVVCFSFAHKDLTTFIVGIEGGGLLRCSTVSSKPIEDPPVAFKDPVLSAYKKHEGAVCAVQCSSQQMNIFLSCGSDKEIRVYNIEQPIPVKVILSPTKVLGLEWWTIEEHMFAVWDVGGFVNFYSIRTGETIPSMKLTESDKHRMISSICFNPRRAELLAVGDVQGKAIIWSVPGVMKSVQMEGNMEKIK